MVTPSTATDQDLWPRLLVAEWPDTRDTVHMWLQIVGKTRLASSPKENHWLVGRSDVREHAWPNHSPIPYGLRSFEIELDFLANRKSSP
jgi:hypothetical protein